MRTDELDYELPDEAIALVPAEPRDSARLLVDRRDHVEHRTVSDLADLVQPGDVIVLNDTRVRPARLRFRRRSGGSAEVLVLAPAADGWWQALVRPSAKIAPGTIERVGDGVELVIGADLGEGLRLVRPADGVDLEQVLAQIGELPLPPYLGSVELDDPERYQTTFSRRVASAAAPTAGLHLTPHGLDAVRARGAQVVSIELVIGLGTFRPIVVDDLADHVMHVEHYDVSAEVWDVVQGAERVIAVGTTAVRALESVAARGELAGPTDLFIRPPYPWAVVDVLMTNFHLPRSSLLAMVEAFVGPRWRELYRVALDEGYRFLSFGDAMWLHRDDGVWLHRDDGVLPRRAEP